MLLSLKKNIEVLDKELDQAGISLGGVKTAFIFGKRLIKAENQVIGALEAI